MGGKSKVGQKEQWHHPKGSQLFFCKLHRDDIRYGISSSHVVSFLQTLFPLAQTDQCTEYIVIQNSPKMSHNDAANNASNSVNKQQWLYLNDNKNNKINRCLFVVFSYYEFYLTY